MYKLYIQSPQQPKRVIEMNVAEFFIGKDLVCHVILQGWNVAKQHAKFTLHENELFLQDLGSLFGTWVNGNKIIRYGPMIHGESVLIGGHSILIEIDQPVALSNDTLRNISQLEQIQFAPILEDPLLKWRRILHRVLLENLDSRRVDISNMKDAELRSNVRSLINEIINDSNTLPVDINKESLCQQLLDEAIGLGPLEVLLKDDSISEVMVNKFDEIWVEKLGKLELTNVAFSDDLAVLGAIERIVTPLGRRIDESSPMVDARLKDGSRVNAIIPPLALRGPSLTIRKFPKSRLTYQGMVKVNSISQQMIDFMKIAVLERLNIIVAGGTGTGKTTFLNIVSGFIPDDERIVTIEDAAELSLSQPNLVGLESRPANTEGKGAVTIRDLVRNSLRMRPDRIVIGECRGGEALDMLQAMNTGHDGSLTTLHANTPRDAMSRLEVLVTMAGLNIPINAIREQIASAVDIVVQLTRFPCGSRKVTYISEITGCPGGIIQMQDLYVFKKTGVDNNQKTLGYFESTGLVPDFFLQLQETGIKLDIESLITNQASL